MRLSLLSVLALAAVAALAACGGEAASTTASRSVVMPFVLGLREPLAVKRIEKAGLQVRLVRRPPWAGRTAVVTAQSPGQGARVSRGRKVMLIVSLQLPGRHRTTQPPCWKTLINDWYEGRVDRGYPVACYRRAIAMLPEEQAAVADELRAELARARGGWVPAGQRGRWASPLDPCPQVDQARLCPAAAEARPPAWLKAAERETVRTMFEGAKPVHTDYIPYPRKIAVVFEFDHVVICGLCSAPSNASLPRGRVIRLSFDRQTQLLGNQMRFCESRRVCLYH